MTAKKSYSRYFIILQEDEKGFAVDANKCPTGYTKIERKNDKCKVSFYVQNLKKDKEPYNMVLVCNDKDSKKLINLGKINVDQYGCAEISREYDINSLCNSGLGMDKVKGACVVNLRSGNMRGVLTGFINGFRMDDWKVYTMFEEEEHKEKESKEEAKEERRTSEVESEVENKIEHEVDTNKTKLNDEEDLKVNNVFDEYEKDIEKFKNINKDVADNSDDNGLENESEDKKLRHDESEHKEEICESNSELKNKDVKNDVEDNVESVNIIEEKINVEKHRENDEYEDSSRKPYNDQTNYYDESNEGDMRADKIHDYPIGKVGEFYRNISKGMDRVTDICPEIGKCQWYRISSEDLEQMDKSMDFNKYNVMYYPMTYYYPYVKKQGHYLVGYKCDAKGEMKYLIYAIPGTKEVKDQPFGGNTGFATWTCRSYEENRMDSSGYWVMFYDFKNGRVMLPIVK